jgi:hypothetical protein
VQQLLRDEAFRTPSLLSHKHRHPYVVDIPRSLYEPVDIELPFLNLPGEFDAGNDDGGVVKALESQHWSDPAFDPAGILFNNVVEIAVVPGLVPGLNIEIKRP